MDDTAIGRKEILVALHMSSWRAVIYKRKRKPGFKKLFKVEPSSGKPMIYLSELRAYRANFNQ